MGVENKELVLCESPASALGQKFLLFFYDHFYFFQLTFKFDTYTDTKLQICNESAVKVTAVKWISMFVTSDQKFNF